MSFRWTILIAGIFAFSCAKKNQSESSIDSNSGRNIVGGTIVGSADEVAKRVVLLYNSGSICTGTIVADDLILTAAHCVDTGSNIEVIFGTKFRGQTIKRQVTRKAISPQWTGGSRGENWGDIALVKFSGGLPAGYKVTSILGDESRLRDGMTVTLAGYGVTNGLGSGGSGTLRKVDATLGDTRFSRTEVLIDQRNGRGACKGDSGGPAFVRINGEYLVFGVTSRGIEDPRITCRKYAAYTNALAFMDWLRSAAARL